MGVMTGDNRKERDALHRLADLLAEDVLNTPDDAILDEFKANHGDPLQNAAAVRALFEKSILIGNKRRLAAARAGVDADRRAQARDLPPPVEIAEARRLLRGLLNKPASDRPVTLAARKETELSDADVLSMLANLKELGILPPDNGEGS
jgi:hypothetical protein